MRSIRTGITSNSTCFREAWDGLGDYRTDSVKGRILQTVTTMDHQVISEGSSTPQRVNGWDHSF